MTKSTREIVLDKGPYLVKSPVMLLDVEGHELRAERATVAMYRCGRSTNKPYCEGTHSKVGFRAAERTVREERWVGP
jgi:CDGSH-type Zn-finger protein